MMLAAKLDDYYEMHGLSDSVIAYRALGKANYGFAGEAMEFAKQHSPVVVLAFDVTGFFDHLDHGLLKNRLKHILNTAELEEHWFKVFRFMTKFRYVALDDLRTHPQFRSRLKEMSREPIASMSELKQAGIKFRKNPKPGKGIPQGTPISAAFSNLYMIQYDAAARAYCENIGAFYRRYSDDILVICKPNDAANAEAEITSLMMDERLEFSPDKTERTEFDVNGGLFSNSKAAQYLGFNLSSSGAAIRQSSLSRQWRKMRRAFKRTRKVAEAEIAAGRADKVWTKKLRRRFTALKFRNFSSYGRRAAAAFGPDERITRQIRRFERVAERELDKLKKLGPST